MAQHYSQPKKRSSARQQKQSPVRQQKRSPARPRRSSRPLPQRLIQRAWLGMSAAVLILCGLTGFAATLGAAWLLRSSSDRSYEVVEIARIFYAESPVGPDAAESPLSVVFTPEIQYWAPLIQAW